MGEHGTEEHLCKPPKHFSPQGFFRVEPSSGTTTEVTLLYNTKTIPLQSIPFLNRHILPEYMHINTSNQRRCYTIYIPKSLHHVEKKVPLVLCLHGTDETAWDNELYVQEKAREKSWQELSEEKQFIVVWGQSCGVLSERLGKQHYLYWWQPGPKDLLYVNDVLNDIDRYLKHQKYTFCIDKEKQFVIGFSNGGLFTSDVIIHHSNTFTACCNYMGGLSKEQKETFEKMDMSGIRKIPLLIITGTCDENRARCLAAKNFFENLKYDVEFIMMEDKKHEYFAESTSIIYDFFIKHSK